MTPMHPDEAALLKAVCAAPDDDLPRLVYADWLDEHGRGVRAEFIRGQIELAKLKRDSKRRRALAFRCRELIDTAEDQLFDQSEDFPPDPWWFRRGFVESLEVEGMHLDEYTAVFRTQPVRRLYSVNYCEIDDLNHIPAGNTLVSMDLTGATFGAEDVRQLARMKQFPHLNELGLMCCELDDEAARVLCDRAFFQNLTTLRVGGNPFTDAGRQLLRDHFGERVTFTCERGAEYLYALDKDDSRFTVGFGSDDTQLLVMGHPGGEAVVFDHAGNLIQIDRWEGEGEGDAYALQEKWLTGCGGKLATIRVKRFKLPDGEGIEDFNWWAGELADPANTERERFQSLVGGWLADGQYRWTWVNDDMWLDREGRVTDT